MTRLSSFDSKSAYIGGTYIRLFSIAMVCNGSASTKCTSIRNTSIIKGTWADNCFSTSSTTKDAYGEGVVTESTSTEGACTKDTYSGGICIRVTNTGDACG